jgi:hypothetical protein
MPKPNTKSHYWVLTLSGTTLWGHCSWDDVLKGYVDDGKVQCIAYRCSTSFETSARCYQVYCVFTSRVGVSRVNRLFPASACVPVHGKVQDDSGYCSDETLFVKLGVEPVEDVTDVQCNKRKASCDGKDKIIERLQEELKDSQELFDVSEDLWKKVVRGNKFSAAEMIKRERNEFNNEMNVLNNEIGVGVRALISHIKEYYDRLDSSIRKTLEKIYRTFPPLSERHTLIPASMNVFNISRVVGYCSPTRESAFSVMESFKKTRMHYHPDKNVKAGVWHRTACLHLSVLLNDMHERIRKDVMIEGEMTDICRMRTKY